MGKKYIRFLGEDEPGYFLKGKSMKLLVSRRLQINLPDEQLKPCTESLTKVAKTICIHWRIRQGLSLFQING